MQLNPVFFLTYHSCWNSFLTNIIFDAIFRITIITPMVWTSEIIFFTRCFFFNTCCGFIFRRSCIFLITVLVIFIAYGSITAINAFWPVTVVMRMIVKQLNSILWKFVYNNFSD